MLGSFLVQIMAFGPNDQEACAVRELTHKGRVVSLFPKGPLACIGQEGEIMAPSHWAPRKGVRF